MKKLLLPIIPVLLFTNLATAQWAYPFNRIGTEDGIGLASNVVYCTYQDSKGFIWVGTANGLQRFDGSKFIQISSGRANRVLLVSSLTQILPADSNNLWLCFPEKQEFGLFNTTTFTYTSVPLKPSNLLMTKNQFKMWKGFGDEVFLSINDHGILHYDKKRGGLFTY